MNINGAMMTAYYPAAAYRTWSAQQKLKGDNDINEIQTPVQSQETQAASGSFVLHISNEEDGEAIGAVCGADHSVTVYKPKNFDAANPVYKVKIWDKDGNATERMVDISKVDPRNSDFIDMFAYSSHLSASGECPGAQSSFISASGNQHGLDERSYDDLFRKNDWVSALADAMQTQYAAGNFEGYWNHRPFWDFLTEEPKLYTKKESVEEVEPLTAVTGGRTAISNDNEQAVMQKEDGLQTWFEGKTLSEWALTDPQYTDSKTGLSWFVRDGKHPYMVGKDAEKFKEMCQESGEPWLKKFAEMTGMIQHLDDNTTAYVGTNGTAIKSRDGKELFVDTSSLTYDMIQNLFQNTREGGNYFDSGYWQKNMQKLKG